MGAAQHGSVQLADIGIQRPAQNRLGFRRVHLSGLHQLHQPRNGDFVNGDVFVKAVKKGIEFFLPEGYFRCQNADSPAGKVVGGHLQGRLNADYDKAGAGRPDFVYRCRRGGVAGNDQSLQWVVLLQIFHRREGQGAYLLCGPGAVGGICGVAVIDEPLPGQHPPQMPQYADAAYAGVKHGNIIMGLIHAFTCSLFVHIV